VKSVQFVLNVAAKLLNSLVKINMWQIYGLGHPPTAFAMFQMNRVNLSSGNAMITAP